MKILVPLIVSILCTLAGCTREVESGSSRTVKPYTVKMKINSDGTAMEITSSAQGHGNSGKKKGWVGFSATEEGTITFRLEGEPLDDQCAPTGQADWVITQIALSDDGDPATQKGSNFGSTVDPWLTSAFPDANSKGELDIPVPLAKTSVKISDTNDYPAVGNGPKIAYYKVTATKCGNANPPVTLTADPGIGNTGK